MNNQRNSDATTRRRWYRSTSSFCALLIAGAVSARITTDSRAEGAESASHPFDADKVAKLSHEAYKVAWDANFWARRDLRFASFRPTALDWETVEYLKEISRKVPWVARDIEKHPATARDSSKRSHELVRYDAMLLKKRYQSTSFQSSTDTKIKKLIRILDDIDSCYAGNGGIKK